VHLAPQRPELTPSWVSTHAGAAHIGAMYTAFLSVAMACGTPGLMAALALGTQAGPCPRLSVHLATLCRCLFSFFSPLLC